MRWVVAALSVAAACGGPQIPQGSGYKSDKAKPWKHPRSLKFDDKLEAKAEGSLSYPDMKRAAWFAIELAQTSEVDLRLEVNPPGDAVNDNFDLAMEVFDPDYRVINKADQDEEDAGDLNKTRQLLDLAQGHYLVHLYLQSRLDTCDYVLHVTVKPTAPAERKSDFPAQVAFLPPLPMIPINDDAPRNYRPPAAVVVRTTRRQRVKPAAPPPPTATITARIIDLRVVSGGTLITVSRGTNSGASAGMHVKINGIAGTFQLAACSERSCNATVPATPDQLRSAGNVVLTP